MKGYKVPQHMIEGRKNWIAQYQKDDKYAWGMSAVIEDIESLPLEELDDNWHTGTPTEDGWYLVAFECVYDCNNKGKIEYFTLNIITDEYGYMDYRGRASDDVWKAVAYQKIEPYEGRKK